MARTLVAFVNELVRPPRRHRLRRFCAFVMSGLLVAAGSAVASPSPAAAAAAAVAGPVCTDNAPTESAARQLATACAKRVEVMSARSGRSQVFAEPGGAFTYEATLTTQRVRRADGSWRAIDRNLRRLSDGTWAPTATTADVRFSAGGHGPLVSWRRDGHLFTMSWPTVLPAPLVQGGSATYPSVLDGVDLVVAATDEGFRHVLVVHTPQAAADPRIRDIRYRLGGDVRASVGADGAVTLTASDGAVFASAPGGVVMWDAGAPPRRSSTSPDGGQVDSEPAAPRSTAAAAGRTADVRPVPAAVVGSDLALRPTVESLTDAVFPVYIDPPFENSTPAWAYSNSVNTPWTVVDNVVQGGEPGGAQIWTGKDPYSGRIHRGFLRFDVSGLTYRHVLTAKLEALVDHTFHCSGQQPVYLYSTTQGFGGNGSLVGHATALPGASYLDGKAVDSANENSCPKGNLPISLSGGLAGQLHNHANAGGTSFTLLLSAAENAGGGNETLAARWMNFQLNKFKLIAVYNSYPSVGGTSTSPATTCVNADGGLNASRPGVNTTPTLVAVASDPDAGENDLRTIFEWQPWNGSGWGATSSGQQTNVPAGQGGQVTPPPLADGSYRWHARVEDPWSVDGVNGVDGTGWSQWCQFEKDSLNPALPSVVSPTDYPSGCTCGTVGVGGRLTFTSSTDVVSYRWGPSNPPSNLANASAPGAATTVMFTPTVGGPTSIYVQAVDRAGNLSSVKTHGFTVPPPQANIGRWLQVDELGSASLYDTSGSLTPHDLTLAAGDLNAPGRVVGESALELTNTPAAGQYATTSAVLNTTQSFTVSAFVRLSSAPTGSYSPTVLSQWSGSNAAIELQARTNGWCLNGRDLNNGAAATPVCGGAVDLNVWTNVVANYDKPLGRFRVYIDGVLVADAAHFTPFAAAGSLAIGRSVLGGLVKDLFSGGISDVRVWQRSLAIEEITEIVAPPMVGKWRFGQIEPPEFDESGHFNHLHFSGPGASVPVGGQAIDGTALQLNGTASAYSNNPVVRTDQSFTVSAWVRPDDLNGVRIVASQDGTYRSGFYLQYHATAQKWAFMMTSADSNGTVTFPTVLSAATPTVGRWTQLVGTYDAGTKQLRIEVDGVPGSVANNVTGWNATGPFRLGNAGPTGGSFVGAIDEVRVYAGCEPACDERFDAGADFRGVQGYNGWFYNEFDGANYSPMTYDSAISTWRGTSTYALLSSVGGHPGDRESVRTWVAPRTGIISLAADWDSISTATGPGADGTKVKIMQNATNIYPGPATGYAHVMPGTSMYFWTMHVRVTAGDTLYFHVNRNSTESYDSTNWKPIITYLHYDFDALSDFSNVQGARQWSYKEYNGSTYTNMNWDNSRSAWMGSWQFLLVMADRQHPGPGKESVRAWVAPKAGVISITSAYGDISASSPGDGTKIRILQGSSTAWPSAGGYVAVPSGGSIPFPAVTLSVAAGETVYFQVNANNDTGYDATRWIPAITYLK